MTRHIHFSFSTLELASRAWRAGSAAIEYGYASEVVFVGYTKSGLPDREEIAANQTVLRIGNEPPLPGGSKLKRAMALPRWWRALLNEIEPEGASLVVAHSLAALPGAVRFARRHNLPILYDAHELETERNGWPYWIRLCARIIEGRLIRACGHTIVVNDSIRDWYHKAYPGVSVSTVRNVAVIPEAIGDSTLRADLGIPKDAVVFAYCGAMTAGRGLPELIEVFREFRPDRHLVMIGSGPLVNILRQQCQGMQNVHVCNPLPQAKLLAQLTGADVGLVVVDTTSLSYRYGLPNKLFEYAAAGLALCLSPGPEYLRLQKTFPLVRITELDHDSMIKVMGSFTREELDEARPLIRAFKPPSWDNECHKLLEAFELALKQTRLLNRA